jgi:DNA-directed RNA polymerase subunit omega
MQQPSLDVLMRKVDSKYELVVAAGKRGRMLTDEKQLKPVSIALNEIAEGKQLKPVSIALNEIAEGKLLIVHSQRRQKT